MVLRLEGWLGVEHGERAVLWVAQQAGYDLWKARQAGIQKGTAGLRVMGPLTKHEPQPYVDGRKSRHLHRPEESSG